MTPLPVKSFLVGQTVSAGGAKNEAEYYEHYRRQGVKLRGKYRRP